MPVRAAASRRGGGHRREFAVRLQFSTWPEVESCLERSTGILIPLGSTEQHGPSGLIGTDALVAEGIAARAASEDEDILVAPTLAYAPAQFNLEFAGTVSVRAGTFARVIEDVVDSLAAGGFAAFYFLNGHGANIGVHRAAFPDGRVGSDSTLSSAAHGDELLATAARELAADYRRFTQKTER